MREAVALVAEHLMSTSLPIALGIIILLLTLRHHLTRSR